VISSIAAPFVAAYVAIVRVGIEAAAFIVSVERRSGGLWRCDGDALDL
jgi:hypothetical protein